jgi:hypothetical protein
MSEKKKIRIIMSNFIELSVMHGEKIKKEIINIDEICRILKDDNGNTQIIFRTRAADILVVETYVDLKGLLVRT